MGTKNDPGEFNCYAAADPDEPIFIMLGRDPCACLAVTFWVKLRLELDPNDPKVDNARQCAADMESYARLLGRQDGLQKALAAMQKLIVDQRKPKTVREKLSASWKAWIGKYLEA